MAGPYLSTGSFKTRITSVDTTAQEELGIWRWEAGKVLRYVKAGSLIQAFEPVRLDFTVAGGSPLLLGNQVLPVSASTDVFMGIAEVTMANLNFGWITVYGPATARVNTNEIPGAALGPSNAAGASGILAIRNSSHFSAVAVALQTGLSMGSAVFVTVL